MLAVLLTKPGTRHNADACLVQQLQRIQRICALAYLRRRLHRSRREVELRVEIQRTGRIDTRYARKGIEPRCHELRAVRKRGVDRVRFFFPKRVRRGAGLGRAHEAVDADLARERRTQADADHLVQQRAHLGRDVAAFEVAAAPAALAGDALGDGVERDERDGRPEAAHDLLEGVEWVLGGAMQVRLVHLVREQDERVLFA